MSSTPLNSEIVKQKIQENKIKNVGNASIREVKKN